MNSGITSVDEARSALGKRLRELRTEAGMSGKHLAESLSWPASKVSKIENGRQALTDEDIHSWTRATNAEQHAVSLLAALHTLELQHAEWNRLLKSGMKTHQGSLAKQDEKTTLYRGFENTFIPGLLQTPDYARARFADAIMMHKVPNDIDDAVRARMQRQEMLYRSDKQFHFVITEAALRYRLASVDVMLAQLDRLVALTSMQNVRLGIVSFKTKYVGDPRHGFWLLDNDLVRIEIFSAELNLRQPEEIELYRAIFVRLARVASYGIAARAIINQVIEELAAEVDAAGA
jgi:transcriptional regulator with XRE-family HTH domain